MHVGRHIRHGIVDGDTVLVIELAQYRRITIGLIRCMVFNLYTHSNIQVFESQASFISNPVAGKDHWHIYRCIPDYLLKVNISMPEPTLTKLYGFLQGNLQNVEQSTFLVASDNNLTGKHNLSTGSNDRIALNEGQVAITKQTDESYSLF